MATMATMATVLVVGGGRHSIASAGRVATVGRAGAARARLQPRMATATALAAPTATRQHGNVAVMSRIRQRCRHSCAPPSHRHAGYNANGVLRWQANGNGRASFNFAVPPGRPAATQRRIRFSTKATQQQKPSSANNNNRTMRTILSSSHATAFGPAVATSTMHPLLRIVGQSLRHALLKPRSLPLPRYVSPQRSSFTLSELFGHSSFILVAASYATSDFLELRVMAVLGSSSMLLFTYFHPHGRVLWLPLQWNLLFIAINSYRIGRVLYDRYKATKLSDELMQFREEHLAAVDMVEFSRLVRIAEEETFEEGDLVLHQGRPNHHVYIILEGELEVLRDGTLTYVVEKGNFLSELGLHAGLMLRGSIESCGTIVVSPPFGLTGWNHTEKRRRNKVRCLRWDRDELVDLLERDKGLCIALQAALSWDIVRKLKTQRGLVTEGRVKDPAAWTRKREDQGTARYASILQNMLGRPEEFADMSGVLTKYRTIHHIDDGDHERALAQCGWTEEEFRLGKRHEVEEDDDVEEEEFENARWRRVKKYSTVMVQSLLP